MTSQVYVQTQDASPILTATDLRKSYGRRPALQGLTFSLKAGRILGFLGPNGAGKTTAIRILTTILEPDSGHFAVDGISGQYPKLIRHKIGVLPENLGFPRQTTAIEYLTFFGQLYGRTATEAGKNAQTLLEDVGLQNRAKSLVGTYSHGMRQRLGIARALVNEPSVVFLDEPTLGLDPRGQQELLGLVRRIARDRGAGVVLCSHMLSEIEEVCDDVVILNAGRVVATGSVADVIGGAREDTIRANVLRIQVWAAFVPEAQSILETHPAVLKVTPTGETAGWFRVEMRDPNGSAAHAGLANNAVLESLIRAEIPILRLEIEGGRLQDVFLHLTEEAIR